MTITVNNVVDHSGRADSSYTPSSVSNALLVAIIYSEDIGTQEPITGATFDGNSLTQAVVSNVGPDSFGATQRVWIGYLASPGTASATFSVSGGDSSRTSYTLLTLGADAALSVDVTNTGGEFGDTYTSFSIAVTTTGDGALALSALSNGNTGVSSVSGATEISDFTDGNQRCAAAHSTQATAGSAQHDWTINSNPRYSAAMVAFKEASGATAITPANTSHGHIATSPTLSANSPLTVNAATHSHTATSPSVTAKSSLTVADATHAHSAGNITLSAASSLLVADALHSHTADQVTLSGGVTTITVNSAVHAHNADNVTVSFNATLAVDDASHAHTATSPTLSANSVLSVNSALHSHTASQSVLSGPVFLTVHSTLHGHTASVVVIPGAPVVEPPSAGVTMPETPRATDPLQYNVPIVDPQTGWPTDFFMRQWDTQILANSAYDGSIDSTDELITVVEGLLGRKIETLAGSGLEGGGDLTADRQLSLTDTGVSPGTYGDASNVGQFTVDEQGRITSAQNVPVVGGSGKVFAWPIRSQNVFSSTAAATKGNVFWLAKPVVLSSILVRVNGTTGHTYISGAYTLDGAGVVQSVLGTSSPLVLGSTADQVIELPVSASLPANTRLFVSVTRTDGGTTFAVPLAVASTSTMLYGTLPIIPNGDGGFEQRAGTAQQTTLSVGQTVSVVSGGFMLGLEAVL